MSLSTIEYDCSNAPESSLLYCSLTSLWVIFFFNSIKENMETLVCSIPILETDNCSLLNTLRNPEINVKPKISKIYLIIKSFEMK